ncbi:hypothetical protein BT69DRAFT_1260899 [Atractiella rhizophila]|nr:hypothetical protein BT69DRAFT_1260899 [Atractiella rhizophila]
MKVPEAVSPHGRREENGTVGSEKDSDREDEEDNCAEEGSDYEQPDESDIDYSYESSDEPDEDSSSSGSEESLKLGVHLTRHSHNLLFLGTATSGCIPTISCVTSSDPCRCCSLAHSPAKSKSKNPLPNPNKRLNTAALITLPSGKTILIDCGKSFRESALEFFPRNGKSVIDALLLTHEHADAAYGLDDLRAWTLGGAIQPSLDVYCDRKTYDALSRVFPYTIDRSASTGGGDVPQFSWHIFEDDQPLHLFGSTIVPLRVEHGLSAPHSNHSSNPERPTKAPYYCLGYLIDDSIAYISDVSQIPPPVWRLFHSSYQRTGRPLDVLVIDCLRLLPHASHYGIAQALLTSSLLRPTRTYLTGFAHRATHSEWTRVGKEWGKGEWKINGRERVERKGAMDVLFPATSSQVSLGTKEEFERGIEKDEEAFVKMAREMTEKTAIEDILGEVAYEALGKVMMQQMALGTWARPAYDGLNIFVEDDVRGKKVWDDSPEGL